MKEKNKKVYEIVLTLTEKEMKNLNKRYEGYKDWTIGRVRTRSFDEWIMDLILK